MATPYTPATSLLTPGRIGQAAWVAALLAGSAHRTEGPPLTGAQATEIVAAYHTEAAPLGLNPDLALAQGVVEAACFTSDLWRERRNPCGLGITGPGVVGKDYGTVRNGIVAHLHHLCCYAHTLATCPVRHVGSPDPRHTFHDGNPRLSHLQEPLPGRRWAEEPGYVGKILAIVNALLLTKEATMGHVPQPPITEHPITKVIGVGRDPDLQRTPGFTVLHSMGGTLKGTDGYFPLPTTAALTDFGIGQVDMGDGYAQIIRWNDPFGKQIGWASGPVKAPEGDGPRILAAFGGAAGLNRYGVAIEHDDTTRADGTIGVVGAEPVTAAQWSATCWLQAFIHAEWLKQTAATYDLNAWHLEFCGRDYKKCPNPRITDHVDEYQAAVRAIMAHWQDGTPYPAGGVIVNGLRLAVPTNAPTPPIVIATRPTPAAPDPADSERKALLKWCDDVPFEARGPLVREGEADLRQFGGGQRERIAIYGKQRFHRLNGLTYAFNLEGAASWEKLNAAKLITLF